VCETIFNLVCILHRIREYLAPALQTKPWRHTIHSGGTRHTGGTVHTDRSRDSAPPGVFRTGTGRGRRTVEKGKGLAQPLEKGPPSSACNMNHRQQPRLANHTCPDHLSTRTRRKIRQWRPALPALASSGDTPIISFTPTLKGLAFALQKKKKKCGLRRPLVRPDVQSARC
jgi:hypothetical protein